MQESKTELRSQTMKKKKKKTQTTKNCLECQRKEKEYPKARQCLRSWDDSQQTEQLQFKQPKYNGDLEAPKVEKTQEEKVMDNFGDIVKEIENTSEENLVNPFIKEKPDYIPQSLWDLMQQDNITEEDIKLVTENKGYFPKGTPMSVYNEQGYLTGYIIPKWEGLKQLLKPLKHQ